MVFIHLRFVLYDFSACKKTFSVNRRFMFSMQRNRHILHIFSVYEIVYLSIDFLNKFLYVALLVCKVLNLQLKQIYLADPGTRNSYENEKDNFKKNSKVLGNQ